MASINVDPKIVEFIKSHPDRFDGKSLSSVIAEAILFLFLKKDDCFACPYHTAQVVGYYLGMQRKSLQLSKSLGPKVLLSSKPLCANCDKNALRVAKEISDCSAFSSLSKVVNDALVEHMTRPNECRTCPAYSLMRDAVAEKDKELSK
jgi:hypothetical protein